MRKLILILLMLVAMAAPVFGTDVHVIVKSLDADTEIEVKVDGKVHTELLDAGANFLPYHTKADKPNVRVLAYGDTLYPKVKKVGGEYYVFIEIDPPKDGDSYGEQK